jgi:hypothetical protein
MKEAHTTSIRAPLSLKRCTKLRIQIESPCCLRPTLEDVLRHSNIRHANLSPLCGPDWPVAVFTKAHRKHTESAQVNNVAVTRTRSCCKRRQGRCLLRSGRLEGKSDDGLGSDRLPIESGCLKTPLLQRI